MTLAEQLQAQQSKLKKFDALPQPNKPMSLAEQLSTASAKLKMEESKVLAKEEVEESKAPVKPQLPKYTDPMKDPALKSAKLAVKADEMRIA